MNKKIYLVEDTADLRTLVEFLLTRMGFNVESFATAGDYLKRIAITLPDLVILDIMLPDGNGIEICNHQKADPATSQVPVLLMSANIYSKEEIQERADVQFISKPFDIDDFANKVKGMAGMAPA